MLYGAEHVRRYRETDGEEGHEWRGAPTLILTTKGRRSGERRDAPLIYQQHGDDYLVVASKGGSDPPPAWYVNLQADPDVEVQIKGDRFRAKARTATPDERREMWPIMTAVWPAYEDYQTRTEREIPIVVLERGLTAYAGGSANPAD
jgi:deazaflavin-dependent oxidoreductase (nitroreductase family)